VPFGVRPAAESARKSSPEGCPTIS